MRLTLPIALSLLFACGPGGPEWIRAEVPTTQSLHTIHGTSATDVYAVGNLGTLLHYDGTTWKALDAGGPANLMGVWAASPSEVWVVGGSGTVLRGNHQRFTPVAGAPKASFTKVWGTAPDDVWLTTGTQTWHYDGSTFAEVIREKGSTKYLLAVESFSGTPATGGWMAANGDLFRIDRGALTEVDVGTERSWDVVVAAAPNDVWVIGGADFFRFDGSRWKPVESPVKDTILQTFWAGFSPAPNEAWFVGENGRIAHFDGTQLRLEVEGGFSAPKMFSLWGASSNDLWAVGEDGWVLRRYVTQ